MTKSPKRYQLIYEDFFHNKTPIQIKAADGENYDKSTLTRIDMGTTHFETEEELIKYLKEKGQITNTFGHVYIRYKCKEYRTQPVVYGDNKYIKYFSHKYLDKGQIDMSDELFQELMYYVLEVICEEELFQYFEYSYINERITKDAIFLNITEGNSYFKKKVHKELSNYLNFRKLMLGMQKFKQRQERLQQEEESFLKPLMQPKQLRKIPKIILEKLKFEEVK